MRAKSEKHLPYFVVLEAFQESKGCALCDLESSGMRHYLDSMLYENVNDPRVRAELKRSHGYCHRHAHQLLTFDNALAVAVLYRDQVRQFLDSPEEERGWSLATLFHGHSSPDSTNRCPACATQLEARFRHIDVLIEGLRTEDDLRMAFEKSMGLCAPHFHAALKRRNLPPDTRRFLIDVVTRKSASLLTELEELCRKFDYQFSAEKVGEEADSWIRAVEMMTGRKDVF